MLSFAMSEVPKIDRPSDELLAQMLANSDYITLATASNTPPIQPETTTVAYAFGRTGNKYKLFWLSSPMSAHSEHIAENPNVSGEIIDQTMPQGTGFKIKLRGQARALTDLSDFNLHSGYELLKDKLQNFPEMRAELVGKNPTRQIYVLDIEDSITNIAMEFERKTGWRDISLRSDAATSPVLWRANQIVIENQARKLAA